MAFDDMLAATNISASGLTAERLRMDMVANNIANAFSTRSANGGPYRRQDLVFAAILRDQARASGKGLQVPGGVEVVGAADDMSELPRIHNPGHPDADREGFVTMPNVHLPIEMVNLITASRAYEANLRVLQSFRQAAEQALTLARA